MSPTQAVLCEFWALATRPAPDATRPTPGLSVGCLDALPQASNAWEVDSIVATVPDPSRSQLEYNLDRYVDAIQRAAEEAGYVLDRHKLPWRPREQVRSLTVPVDPGVLLFRFGSSRNLLVVLLVGETPTTGVQQGPFRSALDQAMEIARLKERVPREGDAGTRPINIRLLGPSFRGSWPSIERGFEAWVAQNPGAHLEVGSGAATAINQKEVEARAIGGGICFRATVIPDSLAIPAFLAYLKSLGVPQERIAVLVESNTPYGRGAFSEFKDSLVLPFPSQISQMRTARAVQKESREELDVPLGAVGPTDVVPAFSPLAAPSAEALLAQLLGTISRGQYPYLPIDFLPQPRWGRGRGGLEQGSLGVTRRAPALNISLSRVPEW